MSIAAKMRSFFPGGAVILTIGTDINIHTYFLIYKVVKF